MIEERKTFYGYLAQIFSLYGITICIFILFGLLVGDYAGEVSSLFAMGSQGLRFSTMLQLLGMSAFITLLRILFFTDILIRNMAIVKRTVGMLTGVVGIIVFFVAVFDWFPLDQPEAWISFFVSFGFCFAASTGVTMLKEKAENRRMEEALKALRENGT